MPEAFICDALRTPIGRRGGALSGLRLDELAAIPIRALMARHPALHWAAVEDVILGCASPAEGNPARQAALLAGLPDSLPGLMVNRMGGSGLEALGLAARAIRSGEAGLLLAGGVDSASLGLPDWVFGHARLRDRYGADAPSATAANVAADFQIDPADQDAYAQRSRQRAAAARQAGLLLPDIAPVSLHRPEAAPHLVAEDEWPHPAPDSAPLVVHPGGITAANACHPADGACTLLLASAEAAEAQGLQPRARIVTLACAGVAPRIMGFGPAPAIRLALDRAGLLLEEIDIIELHDAFAATSLAVLRDLGLDELSEAVNPQGGALALGHPVGMSGARLAQAALSELERQQGRYALAASCAAGGQGLAMILERL